MPTYDVDVLMAYMEELRENGLRIITHGELEHYVLRRQKMACDIVLPPIGREVPLDEIHDICYAYGQFELWEIIKSDPPPKPFKSDGCSMWFDTWKDVDLYPWCFLHDLKYWCGHPGEYAKRLIADAELMIDIANAGTPKMAETMFAGVRAGGGSFWKRSFSWGFGRQ